MFAIFSVILLIVAATAEYAEVGVKSKEYGLKDEVGVLSGGILSNDVFWEEDDGNKDDVLFDEEAEDSDVKENVDLPEELLKQLQVLAADLEIETGITANVNRYSDVVLDNIKSLMIKLQLDPMQIPDIHKGFKKRFILITYTGSIDLTKGWLSDASTVKRQKDILVSYIPSTRKLVIDMPLKFDKLEFNYKYSAKFMGLGPVGGVEGKVRNLELLASIVIDFDTYNASLDTFKITNSGFIDIAFTGHFLTDWIVNLFTDTISLFLHHLILNKVSNTIHEGLNDVVDDINGIIHMILNPPQFNADAFAKSILDGIQWR